MHFQQLTHLDTVSLEKIFDSYELSFPADERRSEVQFQALIKNHDATIFAIDVEDEMIGYLITWFLGKVVFIEHFEVFEVFRNKKYGAKILSEFSKMHPHLVLESEPSTLNEMAARRIGFYERNGFHVIDDKYIQPAYDPEKNNLQLYLMSNFTVDEVQALVQEIHTKVYQV
ncbi:MULTISPECIES: GNAT family N-acetyltransferase [Amniculibacterium]|uniref:GNAT family N-acetyltransferase n=1 Tax=Amniculibacterium TaxID=2715289 RepID=UPI000F591CF3|nr:MULTISPECIES: GNAT family N-acetyltransferase [Amniculibacterium]